MVFNGINDQKIELNIINYQYPDHIDELYHQYNSNWLIINVKVLSNFGDWEATDPALLTFDFEEMIEWFDNLSNNIEPKDDELIFTEPSFLLFLENSYEDDIKKIKIELDLELRIKGFSPECYVEIHANNEELEQISNELRKELSKFPTR
jgi:hypothetical protein